MEGELLRFALPDGRPATLLLGPASTVLAVEDEIVSSWDLAGRPYALVRESGTYRRALDGRLLHKREAAQEVPRLRRRLTPEEGEPVVEAARREAEAALRVLGDNDEAARRLGRVTAMGLRALREDAARFLSVCGRVGILPPDQYLSLVVRVTEGCSWNACTFCGFYRDVPFRWKTEEELAAHTAALRAFFGESIALRSSVFLGDANALCLAHEKLRPLVASVAREFPDRPLASFVDAWTGRGKTADEYREYARLGLRRVYVGLETGDPELLAWLEKAGSPEDAVELSAALHEAGVDLGVIVLLGAGGERFFGSHVTATADVLGRMRLGPRDFLYFSELVDDPGLEYGRRSAGAPDLAPLPPERCAEQRGAILGAIRWVDPAHPPRVATYDIREFVY